MKIPHQATLHHARVPLSYILYTFMLYALNLLPYIRPAILLI